MNKLIAFFLILFFTNHLQAQFGLQMISTCQDSSFCLPANECQATDFNASVLYITDCPDGLVNYNFSLDLANDGNVDTVGSSASLTTDLPIGIHSITFTAFDFCNQTDSCTMIVEVKDCETPVLDCLENVDSFVIYSIGEVFVPIKNLTSFISYDNCTDSLNLKYSYTSSIEDSILYITCTDVPVCGNIPVQVWCTDQYGNQDSCKVTINVSSSPGICPFLSLNSFSAEAITWQGDYMHNVNYFLDGTPSSNYFHSIIDYDCINDSIIMLGDSLSIEYDDDILNGVSTFDLVLISKHILGIEVFTSPYQYIAADVNNSGTVTSLDIVKIRAVILHIEDEFPIGKSWIFDPSYYIVNFDDYNTQNYFTGIKLGDVNGSANPNNLQSSITETRNYDNILNFSKKNQTLQKGETYTIPIFPKNFKNIAGGQFTFEFDTDALVFQNIESPSFEDLKKENFGLQKVEEGFILCSWNSSIGKSLDANTPFYNITFTAKENGELSDFLSINSKQIITEAYQETNDEIQFLNIKLNFEEKDKNYEVSVSPNPFSEKTTLSFYLEKESEVLFEIFDVNGRTIFSQQKNRNQGAQQIEISKKELPQSGIYFYKIQTTDALFSGKILVE